MQRRGSPISCPVCTLYMREGVTLQNHLNTHPKDQVIAALVDISSGELRYKLTCACERSSSTTKKTLSSSSQELPVPGRSTPSVSTQFSQPSSSHFATAITYQQFLSSNGGPEYVPLPSVLPEAETSPSPAPTNQAAFMQMVYNPYMVQHQQQQLLNSISSPPSQQTFIRHVLSPSPGLFSPASINTQTVELSPSPLTINIPFPTDNLATQLPTSSQPQVLQTTETSHKIASSSKSSLTNATIASTSGTSCSTASSTVTEKFFPVISEKEQNTSAAEVPKSSTPEISKSQSSGVECQSKDLSIPKVRDEGQQTEGSCYTSDSSSESYDGDDDTIATTCVTPCHSGKDETTQTIEPFDDVAVEQKLLGPSGSEKLKSECHKETEKQGNGSVTEAENANDKENTETDKEANNQSELHMFSEEKAGPSNLLTSDAILTSDTGSVINTASESLTPTDDISNGNAEGSNNASSVTNSIANDMIEISGLVRNALEIQPPAMCADNNEYMPSEYPEQRDIPDEPPENLQEKSGYSSTQGEKTESSNVANTESAAAYTIISIDGLQIAVPDGLVQASSSLIITPDEPTRAAETQQNAGQCEAAYSGEPDLNIHTDETMPPKGELSEQESVGGNDSFMWTQTFNETSTPCDLLARESWEASDGSDAEEEADADTPPDNDSVPSECNQDRERALPLKLQLKQSLKEPKVYTCSVCDQNFICPKERRVHQSTSHGNVGESSIGETPMEEDGKEALINMTNLTENGQCIVEDTSVTKPLAENSETNNQKQDISEAADVKDSKPPKIKKPKDSVHGYLCSKCPEMFSSIKLRAAHESKEHQITKDVKNVCKTCNATFDNYSSFREHLQIHPLECSHCGKCFSRRQNLDLHIRRHLDIKPHKCTLCDKAFITKQKLVEHVNIHTGDCPIKCPMCDETFRRYSNLIQHKNRHHLKKKKKIKDFICRCGEIFHSKKKLEWHKETHDINPKRCKFCPERFVHVSSLTRHIRRAHDNRYIPEDGRKAENVECTICGFVFLKGSLQVHMRMHKGERPFSCHECGKDFTTKWNLQLHRWTHAARSSKPFKCNICKSAFFRNTDLIAHENAHRKIRPYTCNHCGSRFIRKYNCIRHVREHEAGKTFRCTVCNKTFHRSYYLKEHLRVHTGIRPFACHICGKASTTKSNHNKHVKIHHAREQVNTEG